MTLNRMYDSAPIYDTYDNFSKISDISSILQKVAKITLGIATF